MRGYVSHTGTKELDGTRETGDVTAVVVICARTLRRLSRSNVIKVRTNDVIFPYTLRPQI